MAPADVWLPLRPDEVDGLPDTFNYRFWNGQEAYPGDPAECVLYVVPYLKGPEVAVRPLPRMSHLQVIQTMTAGVDHVTPALSTLAPGVRLCNARGVHDASTAELALTLILASLRGVPDFVRNQERELWLTTTRPALADRTVLIVGYGSIGSAIEERLIPFEVARVDRVARSERQVERGLVRTLRELPELLPQADVVVLATPLTEQTRHLVDASFLGQMKDGALLVNIARGGVVDTDALLAELRTERLRAALDVTDPEPPPPGHPLWHAPGLLLSPHSGGPTSAFLPRAVRLLRDQINRFARDERLHHVVEVTG